MLREMPDDIATGILDEDDARELELICKKKLKDLEANIEFLNTSRIFFVEEDLLYVPETGFRYLTPLVARLFISEIRVKSKNEISIVFNWNEKHGNFVHT